MRAGLERGLAGIESDLFAASAVRIVKSGQPLIEALRRAGREAPDLVFCHVPGEEYVVAEEAPAYQDTQFVTVPGRAVGSNVSGVVFRVDGAAYVAGATLVEAAGKRPVLLVRSPGATGFPGLVRGFRAGMASAGGEPPREIDLDNALSRIAEGEAGAVFFAGYDVPEPLDVACRTEGLPLVRAGLGGASGERESFGTVTVRVDEALRRLARERWAGTLEGRIYSFSLGSGVVDFEFGKGATVSQEVRHAMESARADVLAGIAEIEDLKM